jgi:hypothetical protein
MEIPPTMIQRRGIALMLVNFADPSGTASLRTVR